MGTTRKPKCQHFDGLKTLNKPKLIEAKLQFE